MQRAPPPDSRCKEPLDAAVPAASRSSSPASEGRFGSRQRSRFGNRSLPFPSKLSRKWSPAENGTGATFKPHFWCCPFSKTRESLAEVGADSTSWKLPQRRRFSLAYSNCSTGEGNTSDSAGGHSPLGSAANLASGHRWALLQPGSP